MKISSIVENNNAGWNSGTAAVIYNFAIAEVGAVAVIFNVVSILYPSGTMEQPGRVMLTHDIFLFNVFNVRLNNTSILHINNQNLFYTGTPFCHVFDIPIVFGSIYAGADLVVYQRFMQYKTLVNTTKYRVTHYAGVPSMWIYIWQIPKATREVLNDEERFKTSEPGRYDEDGYYYIVDREKDMIIYRGCNIFPRKTEEVLYTHPKVFEAVVIGVPGKEKSEIPGAIQFHRKIN